MPKKRLTQQQRARIDRRQQHQITVADGQSGLVVARFSKQAWVVPIDAQDSEPKKCHFRANLDSISVGDEVVYEDADGKKAVILAVKPRRSEILRPDGLGKLKPVAANIDQIGVVIAKEPEAHTTLIDRYLVAAEEAGVAASLIINKADLDDASSHLAELESLYRALGYPVFRVSAKSGEGVEAFQTYLKDKNSVLVGQSGVGKSSLTNALLGVDKAATGFLSEAVKKGRHTTTNSAMYLLPLGGYIVDSPGIREFHLMHLTPEDIYAGFVELQPLLGHCQFRDCRHIKEPGCAIRAAMDEKKMATSRILSLNYILNTQTEL